jgi:3-hydroxyisobutyrate dehydrogenase
VIELGSVSYDWALQAAAQCAAAGLRYADAPLSGGAEGAQAGALVALLGAEPADVEAARAVLAPFTARMLHLGPPGSGQRCKMANQLAIVGVADGLAQAQAFSRAAGLDMASVLEGLSLGSAASVQLTRLQAALAEPGNLATQSFAWLRKDLAPCQQDSAAPLPWLRCGRPGGKTRRSLQGPLPPP